MKETLTLCMRTLLVALFSLFTLSAAQAQGADGTDDDGFFVVIKSPANIARTLQNDIQNCGWVGSTYGPSVTEELCGEVVWAFPDSIACGPLPAGTLTDKIALVRRGTCNFSLKVYQAQQAGAKAVIIANHYANSADGPCVSYLPGSTTIFGGMSGGDSAAAVVIPSIYIQRETAEAIDGALNAGETVEVCFSLPNVANPYVTAAYATPRSQVDSVGLMSFVFFNRSTDTINDLIIKADISGPGGSQTIETEWDGIPPGYEDLLFFDTYLPSDVPGKYDVVISNNQFTEPRDTLRRSFEITEYTYATDNFNITNAPFNNASFVAGGFIYQTGALYFTGPNGGTATYSTFGIGNIDSLYTGDPFADEIAILVYDADSDEDGVLNFQSGGFDDLAADIIGSGSYILTGTETLTDLVSTPLSDFVFGGPVALKPNHAYYISLLYDGTTNGSGRCPGFSSSSNEAYLVYDGNALTTPLRMDNLYSGWNGSTIVNRMQLDGFDPTSVKEPNTALDVSKFSITPNPGSEYVNLNLNLDAVNDKVVVQLFNAAGQVYRSEALTNFQSGQIRFEVNNIPSGHYLMWIRTEEGSTIQKVAICH